MMDTMESDGMFGPPVKAPPGDIVLHTIWAYMVKLMAPSRQSVDQWIEICEILRSVHLTVWYASLLHHLCSQ
jgi:hypothetical protein